MGYVIKTVEHKVPAPSEYLHYFLETGAFILILAIL